MKLPMFDGDDGNPSFTVTVSALTLGVVLVKFLLAGITIGKVSFGGYPDSLIVAALLTPTLGSYVMRRGQDIKSNQP